VSGEFQCGARGSYDLCDAEADGASRLSDSQDNADAADLIGCFFGALLNLKLGDWLGRKWTIIV
jgi:hypothetical protein